MTPKPANVSVIPVTVAAPLDGGLNQPSSVIPERPTAPSELGKIVEELDRLIADMWVDTSLGRTHSQAESIKAFNFFVKNAATIRSALAASAPSCPVGEKDMATGQHLVADQLGAISDTEKGAADV